MNVTTNPVSYFINFDTCQMQAINSITQPDKQPLKGFAPVTDYIGYYLDDALQAQKQAWQGFNWSKARFVVWFCGFEPMIVAVSSYLDCDLDNEEVEELAIDYLTEISWFDGSPTASDLII